jgi:hypothetical protein
MCFDVGDGLLGFGKQTRRLFDAWANVGFIAVLWALLNMNTPSMGLLKHEPPSKHKYSKAAIAWFNGIWIKKAACKCLQAA